MPKSKNNKSTIDKINDSTLFNLLKLTDPTGISSYYDAYKSISTATEKPTVGNIGSAIIDVASAMPLLGTFPKLGKGYKLIRGIARKAPLRKITLNTLNKTTKGLDYVNKTMDIPSTLYNLERNRKLADKAHNTVALSSRLLNDGTTLDYNLTNGKITKPIAYNLAKNTGGNTSLGVIGSIVRDNQNDYNGSYLYNNRKDKNKLSGSNKGNIDILKQYIYGHDNKTYDYPILPIDTVYLPKSYKDSLANNSQLSIDTDYLPGIDDFPTKTLIDAKKANGHIDNDILTLEDTWDFSNTTGLLGNKFEEIVSKDDNSGPIKYQQIIPIVYTNDKTKTQPYVDMLKSIIRK